LSDVKYEFDPFEIAGIDPSDLTPAKRKRIMKQVGDLVLGAVVLDVADLKSPVTGRQFKALSKDYREHKEALGGEPVPNLLLNGDMLESLTVTASVETSLTLTVGDDQQAKADGHNNFSGQSRIPRRPFIPNEGNGEKFRPAIREAIASLVEELANE